MPCWCSRIEDPPYDAAKTRCSSSPCRIRHDFLGDPVPQLEPFALSNRTLIISFWVGGDASRAERDSRAEAADRSQVDPARLRDVPEENPDGKRVQVSALDTQAVKLSFCGFKLSG